MASILCITLNPALDLSISLDELRPGEVNRAQESRLDAAGKGNNVAAVLASLGHKVIVSGFLGADNSESFKSAFSHWGVEDEFLRIPGSTRINVKIGEHDGRVSDINGEGLTITGAQFGQLEQHVFLRLNEVDACTISGSLPPGISADEFAHFLSAIVTSGVPVWLDTSGPALRAGIEATPGMVKPNEVELGEWLGTDALDPHDTAVLIRASQRLLDKGIQDAVVSLGGDGVLWNSREAGVLRSKVPSVAVKSTVGAGDTLLAGLLHARLAGFDAERALAFATALAAESVRHVGVGNVLAEDFSSLVTMTHVEQLSHAGADSSTIEHGKDSIRRL